MALAPSEVTAVLARVAERLTVEVSRFFRNAGASRIFSRLRVDLQRRAA
jgi:hypothetical protein